MKPSIFSLEVPSRNNRGFHMFPRLSRLCQGSLSVFISTQFIAARRCRCRLSPGPRWGRGKEGKKNNIKESQTGRNQLFAQPAHVRADASRAVPGGRFVCCRRTLETHLRKKKPPGSRRKVSTLVLNDGKYIYATRFGRLALFTADILQSNPFKA